MILYVVKIACEKEILQWGCSITLATTGALNEVGVLKPWAKNVVEAEDEKC